MNPVLKLRHLFNQCNDEYLKQRLNLWITENIIEVGCSATIDIQSEKFEGLHEQYSKRAFMDIGLNVFSRYADIETINTGYGKHSNYKVYVLKVDNNAK